MNDSISWNHINEKIPEKDKLLLYYAPCLDTPAHTGYYLGEDIDKNGAFSGTPGFSFGHVFGGLVGTLTGDVTHWCYIDNPTNNHTPTNQ